MEAVILFVSKSLCVIQFLLCRSRHSLNFSSLFF